MELRQAARKQAKIKLALQGPSGSGKTMSALLLASGMAEWSKIAVIDTENHSADLYAHLGQYNVLQLSKPFTPERYIKAIEACENASIEVSEQGKIMMGNEHIETFRIADFNKPYRMIREGDSLFRPQLPRNPEIKSSGFIIKQGYLELSNANAVMNMVKMISAQRLFDTQQRTIVAQDQTLDKAVNQLARIT